MKQIIEKVYNVTFFDKEGEVIESTQINENNEALAWELFKEFGLKKRKGYYLEIEEEVVLEVDFEDWKETHFEVCAELGRVLDKENPPKKLDETYLKGGRGAVYELAEQITNEFQENNKGRKWDGERFNELLNFINSKIN